MRHRLQPPQHRAGAGGHDHPQQRAQTLFQAHLLAVLALWRLHPDHDFLERRQAVEILDHPVQIHRRRAMTEIVFAQWAVAALLIFQASPLRRQAGRLRVVLTIQLNPVTELVGIIEGDAVINSHAALQQTIRRPIRPSVPTRYPAPAAVHPGEPAQQPYALLCFDKKSAQQFLRAT